MPEVVVKYKTAKALHALQDFAKYFDIVIQKPARSKKTNPPKKAPPPITFADDPDVLALAGIWKDKQITQEELRKKAWGNGL